MPETVFRDMGGGDDIPDITWAGATAKDVFEQLLRRVPEEDKNKVTGLKSVLSLQRPMHTLVEEGYFEPSGDFEIFLELDLLPPKTAVLLVEGMRKDYIRESWIKGDKKQLEAIKYFDEILERPMIKSLYDTVYPPEAPAKPSLISRLLGRVAFNTPWY